MASKTFKAVAKFYSGKILCSGCKLAYVVSEANVSNEMDRCPVPDCGHRNSLLVNRDSDGRIIS